MKLSFTTLGCPGWDMATICKRGQEYGYQGIDFRGYLDTLDITLLPEFTTGGCVTRKRLADAGLEVCGVSSSITICVPEKLEANLEEARRTIAVAHSLGAPNVRVFGAGDLALTARDLVSAGQDCMERILALDGAQELHWLFETHDRWAKAETCRLLLDAIPNPAFGALWDVANAYFSGATNQPETFEALSGRIGYLHVKDAVHEPGHPLAVVDGWRYVPCGQGQLPLVEAIELMKSSGYDGWILFEHEKRWHPGLPEPEEAFPQFIEWASKVI
jgi:sugar phosphate isomerase/epimerase